MLLGSILIGACAGITAGGTFVWIDVPLDRLTFPTVQEIKIEGHATSPGSVSRVELWIDGALLTTFNDPSTEGTLANFQFAWTPSAPGDYTIQAVALLYWLARTSLIPYGSHSLPTNGVRYSHSARLPMDSLPK